MKSKYSLLMVSAFASLMASTPARAITNFTPSDLSGLSDDLVSTMVETVGIGGDHHAYMPATPLGVLLGFDVGIDMTYIALPEDFRTALTTATGAADVPTGVPLPKLNIHKGLPWNLDLGFSFMNLTSGAETVYKSYGGEVKWAFISGAALPSVAVRGSATFNTLYFIQTTTYTLDVVASKSLYLIDPYVGMGLQFVSGDISIPVGVPGLPASVDASQSAMAPHFYAGTMLKLLIIKMVAQVDYSTAGILTYGGKLSFGF